MDLWGNRFGGVSSRAVVDMSKHVDNMQVTTKDFSDSYKMVQGKANSIQQPHKGQIAARTVSWRLDAKRASLWKSPYFVLEEVTPTQNCPE